MPAGGRPGGQPIDDPLTASATPVGRRRLRRAERREQVLAAATRAFARSGFAATSLDDVAREAGVSRVILYRHFESKTDLYRAVLDRACTRLEAAVGGGRGYTSDSVAALLRAAADDPDGFRLLFHHASRESEFRDQTDRFGADAVAIAHRHLAETIPDPSWASWAAQLVPRVAIDAVTAWLGAGQPDPETAAERVSQAIGGVIHAAQQPSRRR